MAAEADPQVIVPEPQGEVDGESRDISQHPGGKDGGSRLFRRRKYKKGDEKKSRKPPENKWVQQQIPACRPVFTARHVSVVFFIVGVIFLALGITFLVVAMRMREVEIPYTNCEPVPSDAPFIRNFETCSEYLSNISALSNIERRDFEDCHCRVNFTVPEELRSPWYMYYGLGNYFQNHRRYVNSWDVKQLRGNRGSFLNPSDDCNPIRNADHANGTRMPVVPCGLIANSWFNDSFDVFLNRDTGENMPCCNRTNIAWDTDRSVRFQNPNGAPEVSPEDLVGTIMPPNWPYDLSHIDGGLENESFIVWFRVSAFPNFRKLYGRLQVDGSADINLPAGNYSIFLTYNYPVREYKGTKSVFLAEISWLGGRNLFLGIAYIVTATLSIIAGLVLLLIHFVCSHWKHSRN